MGHATVYPYGLEQALVRSFLLLIGANIIHIHSWKLLTFKSAKILT